MQESRRQPAERDYWLALTRVVGIGPARFQRLIEHFGSAERAWRAEPAGLARAGLVGGIGNYSATQLQGFNALSGLNQTGLAPASALSLNSLVGLGVANTAVSPTGANVFGIGGNGFPLFPGQTLGNTTLSQLVPYPGSTIPLGFSGLNPFLAQLGLNFLR